MLLAWVLFPLLVVVLSAGCGLLLERLAGLRLAGPLVVPAGFALIVTLGALVTLADATAELATPLVVALAAAGFALSRDRLRASRPDSWAAGAAVVAFLALGAPVLLSGEATFAGYIKLDDTATWMAFTDRTMEHGRSLDGLAPSSYEATLDLNLTKGYPTGIFVPYGIGAALAGEDVAWVFQPYEALLAAMLALCLVALGAPVIASARLRALVALLASQAALFVGFSLWGGVKEVAGGMLVALVAALAVLPLREGAGPVRAAIPVALAAAALLATLSAGAGVWLLPALVGVGIVAARRVGPRAAWGRAAAAVALVVAVSVPVIVLGGLLPLNAGPLTNERSVGNLLGALSPLQAFGIWPSGDFRLDPDAEPLAYALIGLAALLALVGIAAAWKRGAGTTLLYVAGTALGSAVVVLLGSPWSGAKALALVSPALLFSALLGAAALAGADRPRARVLGGVAVAALAAGVVWSNALAYREVNLAPHDQLAELELIGERISGQGPTLMTEYQPYGVRHFLRDADPEGASELRRRAVLLRGGEESKKGAWADTDELATDGLLIYRTLVLRRSPAQSRPPSPYELTWSGDYYEVWQRPVAGTDVLARLPLGRRIRPAGTASCGEVERLARLAGRDGRLAAAPPSRSVVIRLTDTEHPDAWEDRRYGPSTLLPRGEGEVTAELSAPPGRYELWLGGSVRGEVEIFVDGALAGSARHRLNNPGQYVDIGEATLGAGRHEVTIRYSGPDLHPGSGGQPFPLGPLVLSASRGTDSRVVRVHASRARELCGRRWDWVEAVSTTPG